MLPLLSPVHGLLQRSAVRNDEGNSLSLPFPLRQSRHTTDRLHSPVRSNILPRPVQTRNENMKMINKSFCLTLTLALGLSATVGTTHAFSLGDAAKLAGSVAAPDSATASSAELVSKLTDLNVSTEQAVGGTSALLDLARNQLPSTDYAQLLNSVPALHNLTDNSLASQAGAVSGLLGKANPLAKSAVPSDMNSLTDVGSAFSALGMDAGMVSQFAPVLLQFIGNQGVGQPLLGTLTNLWTGQPAG